MLSRSDCAYPPLCAAQLYAYFTVGSIISKWIMSPVVRIVAEQERLEGDFRFSHVRIRNFAESVAFYKVRATRPSVLARAESRIAG